MIDSQNNTDKKLSAMKYKILVAERDNLKTHEKNNDQMVETIRKIIQHEAEKNY